MSALTRRIHTGAVLKDGRYEVGALLGSGSSGTVYEGMDRTAGSAVAIKVLSSSQAIQRARFEREAATLSRLDHPNLVHLLDHGEQDPERYLVMERVPGAPLFQRRLEAGGSLSPAQTLKLLSPLCAALDYLHGQSLVHRDLKPGNILIADDGRVTLLDLGLVSAGSEAPLTRPGSIIGTPQYMSPEQIAGAELDARSDIYALGLIAYELLTGAHPFEGEGQKVMRAHLMIPPPKPSARIRTPLPALDEVLARALAKQRGGRQMSAGQLLSELTLALKDAPDEPLGIASVDAAAAATLKES